MALVESLYNFFGFNLLSDSATFVDLLNNILQIGCGLWITIFIIRSLFMATNVGGKSLF